MVCELAEGFGRLAAVLPNEESEWLSLSEVNLPIPAAELSTDRLCLTWGYHFYGNTPVEQVTFEADKPTYRHLGLLILSSVFHRQPERVAVKLLHKRSTIKQLVIGHNWDDQSDYPGYLTRPLRFNYYPELMERHPWCYTSLQTQDLPCLSLTKEQVYVETAEAIAKRDVAEGFGHDRASCLFAELLLNASLPANETVEYELEGELGFRGVGQGSAEMKLWLPGGLGYLDAPVAETNESTM